MYTWFYLHWSKQTVKGWSEIRDRQDHTVGQLILLAYHRIRKQTLWRIQTVWHMWQTELWELFNGLTEVAHRVSVMWIILMLQTVRLCGERPHHSHSAAGGSCVRKDNDFLVPFLYILVPFCCSSGNQAKGLAHNWARALSLGSVLSQAPFPSVFSGLWWVWSCPPQIPNMYILWM